MPEDFRNAFESLGVSLGESDTRNVSGDCPLCGREGHFYLDKVTGQWDCKLCASSGNFYTFLTLISKKVFIETHKTDWERLTKNRSTSKYVNGGLPVEPLVPTEVFKLWRMGWTGQEWWLPCYNAQGNVMDIRRWSVGKFRSTTGCQLQLGGIKSLLAAAKESIVWVCEGEWDAMMLRWLLDMAEMQSDVVVYVPGASVFKQQWVEHFKDRTVILCYDNDDAGDRGSMKAGHLLRGTAKEVYYICWPETLPTGWDIRDYVLDGRGREVTAKEAIEVLESVTSLRHRRDPTPEGTPLSPAPTEPIAYFPEVLEVFGRWIRLNDDLRNALAVCLAICLGNDVPGDPLWLYLVGPSGSGKTMILLMLQDSPRTKFYSTLTPKSLVSGFKIHPDPSLLPHLDGKTAIFKDGTELLALHPDARREVYGVLRGAFDGSVYKPFGNGVVREYTLHFNLIIGITPAIHGDNQSTMGERCLKFELREELDESQMKIKAAIGNIAFEMQMQLELCDVVRRFLEKNIDLENLPRLSEEMINRITALSQLLGMLRAQVDRDTFGDRDIKYRPSYEVGTRVAKQLVKLAMMLTYVFDIKEVDEKIYSIIERVAMDTVIGFHLDILLSLMMRGNIGMTHVEIGKVTTIPLSTTMRRLQDLEQLRIMERVPSMNGVPTGMWRVRDSIVSLWDRAALPRAAAPAQAHMPQQPQKQILPSFTPKWAAGPLHSKRMI